MDLRYMGFDQTLHRRVYKFDYCAKKAFRLMRAFW